MALRLALVDSEDERFTNPAPPIPAGIDPFELGQVVEFYDHCLAKYLNKAPRYKQAWKKLGASGNLVRVLSKAERLKNMYWGRSRKELAIDDIGAEFLADLEDNLLDIPNLCAFMRINIFQDNSHGQ
jgi:hypothetical protein